MMDQNSNTAVRVRNASKSYGKRSVLHNLNMHLEKGIIYGLLGSSGCGKTTLLNCIVGRKKLDSGTLWVLGGVPGSKESGIPGPRVGYMPQETALIAEFTVKSALYYFGRIFCMSDIEIETKFSELNRLLNLPPSDRFIADCSGGQQRRVSFAAALMSTPELLVLDEPTVGLDPLLREGIWNYLLKLTESHMTSVLITTHYIEETRQAHKIGFMRHGRLLGEESPEILLNRFGTHSLEDVFLTLCRKEAQETLKDEGNNSTTDSNIIDAHSSSMVLSELCHSREILTPITSETKFSKTTTSTTTANAYRLNFYRIKALLGKSWLQVSRNYSGVAFMFIFPIFQILAFFVAVGDNVKDIKIAVVNHEDNFGICTNYVKNNSVIPQDDYDCEFRQLGCYFLQKLNDPMIDPVSYDDINKGKDAVRHGKASGVLYIPQNFTESFHDKLMDGDYDNSTLKHSQIQVWLDMSNHQIGAVIKAKLTNKTLEFLKSLYSDCNISSRAASNPINFDGYMYGGLYDTFTVFMVPAILISAMSFFGTANAATIMITDRLEGIWDRTIVAGVSTLEIVLVHFVTQVIIIIIQAVVVLVLTFPIYKTEYVGNFAVITLIIILGGVCGISFGFLISTVSNGYSMAHIVTTGCYFPQIVLCGMMWPLEGMPKALRWISLCLPATLPTISLRNVMKKGRGILHKDVIGGIGVEVLWIGIIGIITILEIKRRR